jgi:hypothetical protein
MNNVIHNISVLLIFFGAILLTYNLTKTYNKCPSRSSSEENIPMEFKQKLNQERPSEIFNRMFSKPDVWMGYADIDTKTVKSD